LGQCPKFFADLIGIDSIVQKKLIQSNHALSLLGIGLEGGAEEPYFTPEERAALRAWQPSALPVFGDLVFDRTRSRGLTVLLFTLAGLASFLQLFLPQLSLGPLQLQRIKPGPAPCDRVAESRFELQRRAGIAADDVAAAGLLLKCRASCHGVRIHGRLMPSTALTPSTQVSKPKIQGCLTLPSTTSGRASMMVAPGTRSHTVGGSGSNWSKIVTRTCESCGSTNNQQAPSQIRT
jgi:hypothetical protein